MWRSQGSGLIAYSLAMLNNVSYNVVEFAKSQVRIVSQCLPCFITLQIHYFGYVFVQAIVRRFILLAFYIKYCWFPVTLASADAFPLRNVDNEMSSTTLNKCLWDTHANVVWAKCYYDITCCITTTLWHHMFHDNYIMTSHVAWQTHDITCWMKTTLWHHLLHDNYIITSLVAWQPHWHHLLHDKHMTSLVAWKPHYDITCCMTTTLWHHLLHDNHIDITCMTTTLWPLVAWQRHYDITCCMTTILWHH